MSVRTVAIVQARMSSTRLPGKVLQPILGVPMLSHVMRRLQGARSLDEVVVATSDGPEDDVVRDLATAEGWGLWRGSRDDVLDRYEGAARAFSAERVVRVTSDCPLIDPDLVDDVVMALAGGVDYCSNSLEPRTYPRGLDCEAMTREALVTAWREDHDPAWREHVTPFLYRHPERFNLKRVANDVDLSVHRWCVDVPEDLELVRHVYDELGDRPFGWREVLAVCDAHPEWSAINREVVQKRFAS